MRSRSERVRRGSVSSSLAQCCRASVAWITAELLIEGMRADAALEAGLVERSVEFCGRFGGGEVEDGSGGGGDGDAVAAGDVARVQRRCGARRGRGGCGRRRSRASGPRAVGASPRERRLGRRSTVPSVASTRRHRRGVLGLERADEVHAVVHAPQPPSRARGRRSRPCSTRPPASCAVVTTPCWRRASGEDPRLAARVSAISSTFSASSGTKLVLHAEFLSIATAAGRVRDRQKLALHTRTPSLTSRRSPAPSAHSEQSRYEPVRLSASSVMIAS